MIPFAYSIQFIELYIYVVITLARSSFHPGAGTICTVAALLEEMVARLFSSSLVSFAPGAPEKYAISHFLLVKDVSTNQEPIKK